MRYKFKHQPYAHQLTALEKSWDKNEYALFCEMGTGKSKILIDNFAMLYDNGQIDGVLVVAPKGVYKNWQRKEVPEHLPEHIVADIVVWSPNHTKKQLEHLDVALKDDDNLKVLIMNVEAFSTDKGVEFAKQFLRKRKVFMAVDESTTIKNRSAKRTKNIVNVGGLAKYRRIATGSPITKTPMDLFSQCDFLDPHLLGFGSFFSFQARYCKMWRRSVGTHSFNQVVGYQNLEELTNNLDRFSYRILKKDCLDLPEKIYIKRLVELTPEQRRVYDQLKTIALAVLEQGVVTAANALTQILRLQQVCSGFLKTDDGKFETIPSNKLNELMEALEEVDGKVIIWANYTHDIYAIAKAIQKEYGEGTVRMYFGETKAEDRQQIVEDFQDPNNSVRFFVGQPRTGGYGLTLTEAKTVIYYSNSYDLEVRLQSEDRAHRIGQKNNVTYIDIVTEGTVDEKILSALRDKIDIASTVLKEGYKEWLI
jgi:SNF2 family DNA or RNA helicase